MGLPRTFGPGRKGAAADDRGGHTYSTGHHRRRNIDPTLTEIGADATRDCDICHLPMMPIGESAETVMLECANRHHLTVSLPSDPAARERVRNWIARRGAQLHAQHERWEAERED